MRRLAILIALAACGDDAPAPAPRPADAATTNAPVERRLPAPEGDAIGVAAPIDLVAVADDGAWVAICDRGAGEASLRIVPGAGEGVTARVLHGAGPRDVLYARDGRFYRLDVAARVEHGLSAGTAAALDPESRRVVVGREGALVVYDVGRAPRILPFDGTPTELRLRRGRWAEVSRRPSGYHACGDARYPYADPAATVVDLDPVEAVDAVGPQIAVTAGGEITLAGKVVAPAECAGQVIAALAEPPALLVHCASGDYLHATPAGTRRLHDGQRHERLAAVADDLILDRRVVCLYSGCADLRDGAWISTWDPKLVVGYERYVVLGDVAALHVRDLDADTVTQVPLPRLGREVKVDLVTGKRTSGPEPREPSYVDLAGRYLLYGRHVVDLEAAAVVTTLGEDALAIDTSGRVLVPAAPGRGPLRWLASERTSVRSD